jgi:hypothetical protein
MLHILSPPCISDRVSRVSAGIVKRVSAGICPAACHLAHQILFGGFTVVYYITSMAYVQPLML